MVRNQDFKLAQQEDGVISGKVYDVDLYVLAVPPEDRKARVIGQRSDRGRTGVTQVCDG